MPQNRSSISQVAYVPPADDLERTVASVMAEVMDVDQVGRRDSFYSLGGGSMHAIRICARLEREVGRVVEPLWLLENDELADFVDQLRPDRE